MRTLSFFTAVVAVLFGYAYSQADYGYDLPHVGVAARIQAAELVQRPALSPAPDQPIELGIVRWSRDFDGALAEAAAVDKPVLMLFQEVPGCANCTRFGEQTLSHPLIAEAIETLFVPVAVYNNRGGADAKILKRYGEPAWNNPVVRIVDAAGRDLVARMPHFRSRAQVTSGMIAALEATGRDVPAYLRLVDEELRATASSQGTATFQTACFWSGEGYFGGLDGVVGTEAGWQDGAEVVRVRYDRAGVSPEVLAQAAQQKRYAAVENGEFRLDREPKYYLRHSRYADVEMGELQAARVNSALGLRQNPEALLSPRQLASLPPY